jgi:hypothetical protein
MSILLYCLIESSNINDSIIFQNQIKSLSELKKIAMIIFY